MKPEAYSKPHNYFLDQSCDFDSEENYMIKPNCRFDNNNQTQVEKLSDIPTKFNYTPTNKIYCYKYKQENDLFLLGLATSYNSENSFIKRFNAIDFRRLIQQLYDEKFYADAWNISPQNFNSKIEELIESSRYILKLEEGWDDENALAIDKSIWETATNFLRLYGNYFTETFLSPMELPEISPTRNNSIDLEWRTEKGRLLINFNSQSDLASYYGDRYANIDNIKGTIAVSEVKEYLAVWMKNCL
ncbi:hypothetical protein [Chitinophaga silvisoli]|uniref:Uncharacterized protein n=1 Tax=Chitinophaga silvisoli TaxID=2291814 RepID=A0A3E1NT06_9BACT|nr:hypothetical protein [Chitinophaga silvisoli]RFM30974.1 hypothetical protein DXN04_30890 [Chitinophaga silvisoli]